MLLTQSVWENWYIKIHKIVMTKDINQKYWLKILAKNINQRHQLKTLVKNNSQNTLAKGIMSISTIFYTEKIISI